MKKFRGGCRPEKSGFRPRIVVLSYSGEAEANSVTFILQFDEHVKDAHS